MVFAIWYVQLYCLKYWLYVVEKALEMDVIQWAPSMGHAYASSSILIQQMARAVMMLMHCSCIAQSMSRTSCGVQYCVCVEMQGIDI